MTIIIYMIKIRRSHWCGVYIYTQHLPATDENSRRGRLRAHKIWFDLICGGFHWSILKDIRDATDKNNQNLWCANKCQRRWDINSDLNDLHFTRDQTPSRLCAKIASLFTISRCTQRAHHTPNDALSINDEFHIWWSSRRVFIMHTHTHTQRTSVWCGTCG